MGIFKDMITFAPGTGKSKTVIGIILIFIWHLISSKNPELATTLPYMNELLLTYTGIAGADRLQKMINK